jgi:pimeloyl-ACP methyl ester carboxylesterase
MLLAVLALLVSMAAHAAIEISPGSGSFVMPGGKGHEAKTIQVYYHQPHSFSPTSPILIVMPGAGRNADVYRDSWIDASEKYGVLVLSPAYAEPAYDPYDYNFGGVLRDVRLRNIPPNARLRVYRLRDEDIQFEVSNTPDEWLFNDLDRLFDMAARAVGSAQTGYDLFGHSAGGQILHRLALFHPSSKARRIIAANSGFYTLPRLDVPMPFGLAGTPVTEQSLKQSFRQQLVIFLGELDNENETRGIHLHTPTADAQGTGRLARGKTFHAEGRRVARALAAEFNWKLVVNPGVGHDQEKMGALAARYLYAPP